MINGSYPSFWVLSESVKNYLLYLNELLLTLFVSFSLRTFFLLRSSGKRLFSEELNSKNSLLFIFYGLEFLLLLDTGLFLGLKLQVDVDVCLVGMLLYWIDCL